jgi:cell fate (sporulation/competence/biofilm development) regulator YlbF (YheA/YmcA/DUF963 family)
MNKRDYTFSYQLKNGDYVGNLTNVKLKLMQGEYRKLRKELSSSRLKGKELAKEEVVKLRAKRREIKRTIKMNGIAKLQAYMKNIKPLIERDLNEFICEESKISAQANAVSLKISFAKNRISRLDAVIQEADIIFNELVAFDDIVEGTIYFSFALEQLLTIFAKFEENGRKK